MVSGNRALAFPFVDARVIQDRLDAVVGVAGWQDEYECLPDGSVLCQLRLRLGDEWVTKVDVGGPSEQPDGGDRMKAAFSDALKRAAVKFGVGRYLHQLPGQWVDYDGKRKQFLHEPALPGTTAQAGKPAAGQQRPPTAAAGNRHAMPADGRELYERLQAHDAKLAAQGLCERGALVKHVIRAGGKAGHPSDITTWTAPAIALAAEEAKRFEADCRKKLAAAGS